MARYWSAAAALITAAVYLPLLSNGFVLWDTTIINNPRIETFSWANAAWMLSTFYAESYQPLAWPLYALLYRCQGLNPQAYHAVSVGLHALNAGLLCALIMALLKKNKPGGLKLGAAGAAAALFFSLNPVSVEIVAWASAITDLLASTFVLAALLSYARSSRLALPCVFLILSALCRWQGLSLPVSLLLIDRHLHGRLTRKHFIEKIPFALVSLGLVLLYRWIKFSAAPASIRPLETCSVAILHLWHLIFPTDLLPAYVIFGEGSPALLTPLNGFLIFAALSAGALALRSSRPGLIGVWIYFLAALAPTMAASAGPFVTHDRYAYVAAFGLAALTAGVLLSAPERYKKASFVVSAAVLIVFALLTGRQAARWRDPITLRKHVYTTLYGDPPAASAEEASRRGLIDKMGPHPRKLAEAWSDLGVHQFEGRRIEPAIESFKKALSWREASPDIHNNLGLALFAHSEPEAAIRHYRRALELKPLDAQVRKNLAMALMQIALWEQAEEQWLRAIERQPQDAGARQGLEMARAQLRMLNLPNRS